MSLKLIGAVLIVAVCGGMGFRMAAAYRMEVRTLQELCMALEHMECEMLYRLTPLPELCCRTGAVCNGVLKKFFTILGQELESQVSPDVAHCVHAALCKVKGMPQETAQAITQLGVTLGCFDLEGQLKGLTGVRETCRQKLELLSLNQDARLRGYQTLGLCAGAAVVILFI